MGSYFNSFDLNELNTVYVNYVKKMEKVPFWKEILNPIIKWFNE